MYIYLHVCVCMCIFIFGEESGSYVYLTILPTSTPNTLDRHNLPDMILLVQHTASLPFKIRQREIGNKHISLTY